MVGAATAAPPTDRFPRAAAGYLVEFNGKTLWARAPDGVRPPASLAKLMTARLVVDSGRAPTETVQISREAATVAGTRLGLRAGEAVVLEEALDAMLVASANDACMALAEHVAGSTRAFVARMNAEAQRLGMSNTQFGHPCGLDVPGQGTTPADLLKLAHAAIERPRVVAHTAHPAGQLRTLGGRTLTYRTSNALLGRVDGAQGLKTGFTQRAGKCLIAWIRRPAGEAILVLLDAPDRWWTASILIDEVFGAAPP